MGGPDAALEDVEGSSCGGSRGVQRDRVGAEGVAGVVERRRGTSERGGLQLELCLERAGCFPGPDQVDKGQGLGCVGEQLGVAQHPLGQQVRPARVPGDEAFGRGGLHEVGERVTHRLPLIWSWSMTTPSSRPSARLTMNVNNNNRIQTNLSTALTDGLIQHATPSDLTLRTGLSVVDLGS